MTQDASRTAQRQGRTGPGGDVRSGVRAVLRFVASVVRIVTVLFAFVLVVHVVLTVAGANPVNGIAIFFRDTAARLTLGIGDLFLPDDPSLKIILNFGLAAVLWIVIGIAISKILGALSPRA